MVTEKVRLEAEYKDGASAKIKKGTKELTLMGKAAAFVKTNALALTAAFAAMSLVVGKLVGWLKDLVTGVADVGDQFDKMSPKVGVSVEELSALKLAVELSGSSLEQLGMGLRLLSQNAVDFSRGMGEAKQTFIDFGIGVTNADGTMRGTLEIMMDFADAFADMEDGALKTAAAQDVFGRSGGNLIPLLNQGSDAIEEIMERSKELGVVWSTEDAAAAAAFNDSITELSTGMDGLEKELSLKLIPQLTELIETLTDVTIWANDNADAIWNWSVSITDAIANAIPGIGVIKQLAGAYRDLSAAIRGEEGEPLGPPVELATIAAPKRKGRGRAPGKAAGAGKDEEPEFLPGEFLGLAATPESDTRFEDLLAEKFEAHQALLLESQLTTKEIMAAHFMEVDEIETAAFERQISRRQELADVLLGMSEQLAQQSTTVAAKGMAMWIQGQSRGGQELSKAAAKMFQGLAGQFGEFLVARGFGDISLGMAENAALPGSGTASITAGAYEIAKGTALKAASFLSLGGGGGGGAGGGGGGGGGFVGGGVLAGAGGGPGALPAQEVEEAQDPATEGSAFVRLGHLAEQLRGHVVIGDLGDIATALGPALEEVVKRDNISIDLVGI